MSRFQRFPRGRNERDDYDRPDIDRARAELARTKRRRPDVDAVVAALAHEQNLNDFTANVIITYRGGHRR